MNFYGRFEGAPGEQRVRGFSEPLPFYMSHPGYRSTRGEDKLLKDLQYFERMYPEGVRKYGRRIAQLLDRLDYEGSMIYDEYPDKYSLRAFADTIMTILAEEEETPPSGDLIQVLLLGEIYKRRHNGKSIFTQGF